MSDSAETAMYLAAAAPCFLAVLMLVRWASPVNGHLSPKLQPHGMEILVGGVATLTALTGLGFVIGAILSVLK